MGRRRLVVVMRYAMGGIEPQGSLFGLAVYAVQVGGCVAPTSGGVADAPSPGRKHLAERVVGGWRSAKASVGAGCGGGLSGVLCGVGLFSAGGLGQKSLECRRAGGLRHAVCCAESVGELAGLLDDRVSARLMGVLAMYIVNIWLYAPYVDFRKDVDRGVYESYHLAMGSVTGRRRSPWHGNATRSRRITV